MSTNGIVNGTQVRLWFSGGETVLCTNMSINIDHKLRDTTVLDSMNWRQQMEGMRGFSADAEGYLAYNRKDTSYGSASISSLLQTALINQNVIICYVTHSGDLFPYQTQDDVWYGKTYLTGVELSAPNEDSTTWNISLKGTGSLRIINW